MSLRYITYIMYIYYELGANVLFPFFLLFRGDYKKLQLSCSFSTFVCWVCWRRLLHHLATCNGVTCSKGLNATFVRVAWPSATVPRRRAGCSNYRRCVALCPTGWVHLHRWEQFWKHMYEKGNVYEVRWPKGETVENIHWVSTEHSTPFLSFLTLSRLLFGEQPHHHCVAAVQNEVGWFWTI